MDRKTWVKKLGETIDKKDSDGFANYLTENGIFRFGNQPEVRGRKAVRDQVAQFFNMIQSSEHKTISFWEIDNTVTWQGRVTYTRLDSKQVPIDFCDIFYMKDGLIDRYLIYIDITPLFA
jgi:hypothetical protein